MLTFFTKRFGVAYPWDKYAQVVVEQFTAGGMENTSNTTMNERILLDKRATLDGSNSLVIRWRPPLSRRAAARCSVEMPNDVPNSTIVRAPPLRASM